MRSASGCCEPSSPLDPAHVVRGQYNGYRDEPAVAPGSQIETFCAARLHIHTGAGRACRSAIRAGKRLAVKVTEVLVLLRRPPHAVFERRRARSPDYVRIRLAPAPELAVGVRIKAPGELMAGQPTELVVASDLSEALAPYERLLGDALAGDPTLFASQAEVEAQWAVVDPVLDQATPLSPYEPGSWGPAEADRLVADLGGWRTPTVATPLARRAA